MIQPEIDFTKPARSEDIRENRGRRLDRGSGARGARDYAAEARAWRDENPAIYRLMLVTATRYNLRFGWWSISAVTEWARLHVRGKKRKGKFWLNNSWRAPLARMMCADRPGLAGGIECRTSAAGPKPYPDARPCPR